MSGEFNDFGAASSVESNARKERVRGWKKFFGRVPREAGVEIGEPRPFYTALHPKQQKAFAKIESEIDARFSALESGKPITKEKTVHYKYKGNNPIMHEEGFLLPDYRFEFASIRTNTDRYRGVHVMPDADSMTAALVEAYRAKGYHVLATQVTLNDPESIRFRDRGDSDLGKFWELDICKDALPAPQFNPFIDVEMISFGQ